MNRYKRIPVVTASIVIINIVVFLLMDMGGRTYDSEFMLAHGALSYTETLIDGEYYRLVTHFFMHFGIEHLANNMFVFAALGYYLEDIIGKVRFLILYLASGLISGIVSVNWYYYMGEACISAGASGAIFGIIGALAVLLIRYKGQLPDISFTRIVLFLLLTLYSGYQNAAVDSVAHIAGFITGAVIIIIMECVKGGRKPCA